jgi:hypothetical protein
MRRKVYQIRDYLYGGGYLDPLSNAEQVTFLLFFLQSRALTRPIFARPMLPAGITPLASRATGRCAIR